MRDGVHAIPFERRNFHFDSVASPHDLARLAPAGTDTDRSGGEHLELLDPRDVCGPMRKIGEHLKNALERCGDLVGNSYSRHSSPSRGPSMRGSQQAQLEHSSSLTTRE